MPDTVLFSTLAVRKALDDHIVEAFTSRTGISIVTVFDPTVQLLRRIHNGEPFDVVIGVSASFDGLARDGIIAESSRRPVASTGVGLAVPPGAPPPDINSVDAFVSTLLSADSVAYSRTGASGIYFAQLIERLGIADDVNSRATIIESGFVGQAVVDGRADIAIQQLSELLFVPQARIVGPLPAEIQHHTEFSAALGVNATGNADARALIDFLSGPTARDAYRRTNLSTA
jgi:molybdate transport system substrate-binding protein